jgi:hypothetical protein
MGMEEDLPPSSPPPIDSPLLTPALDRLPGFDFASAAGPTLFASGLDFESPNGLDFASGYASGLDFASGTQFPQFAPNNFVGLDSPSFGRGLANFNETVVTPSTNTVALDLSTADSRYRIVSCTECGKLVKCYPNSNGPLRTHQLSKPCQIRQARNKQQLEMTAAAAALGSSVSPPSSSLAVQPILAALPIGNPSRCMASDSTFLRGRELARSRRRGRSNSRSRSPTQGHRSSSVPADTYTPELPDTYVPETVACPGLHLNWAGLDSYPWGIHMSSNRMNLPYRLDRFGGDGDSTRLYVRSTRCTGSAGVAQPQCAPCHSVKLGQALYTLETRAQTAPSHTPYQYLTQKQLVDALRQANTQKRTAPEGKLSVI